MRAAIGVTGQFSAVDELLTGEENMRLMADLHHLGRAAGAARVPSCSSRFELVGRGAAQPCRPTPGGCAAGWIWP